MTEGRNELVAIAREASARAHAPYSRINVGAAIRSATGAIYIGANVENAAYPLGNCAETSAIAAGVAAEGVTFRVAEIAVWATDGAGSLLAASPCGGCRQRIHEHSAEGGAIVFFPWQGGATHRVNIRELLPLAFSLPSAPRRE